VPRKAPHACPGCGTATTSRYCTACTPEPWAGAERYRKDYNAWYHTARWHRLRALVLREEPLCRAHLAKGETRDTAVADHIKPHRGDARLMWDRANLQGLCKDCHDAKTARGQ
jgi:5-methylcytosine-specific restriction protein A